MAGRYAICRQKGVAMRTIAIALLVAGVVGLMYGGFTYTRQTHDAKVGPLEISVSENQRVNVPMWMLRAKK